jgi:hypothetical protein
MFKARGTKALNGHAVDAEVVKPVTVSEPDTTADAVVDTIRVPAFVPSPADADLEALGLTLGMAPRMPELPGNFQERVRAANAGDIAAIQEVRAIGQSVPEHLRLAFAEIIEQMLEPENA